MRKPTKNTPTQQPDFVDMEDYFHKDKRSKRIEEKRMRKLLKDIHEAEDFEDDGFDEDVEQFKRMHHRDDE
jgi:hypothetical protein